MLCPIPPAMPEPTKKCPLIPVPCKPFPAALKERGPLRKTGRVADAGISPESVGELPSDTS